MRVSIVGGLMLVSVLSTNSMIFSDVSCQMCNYVLIRVESNDHMRNNTNFPAWYYYINIIARLSIAVFHSCHSLVCLNVAIKFKVFGLIVEGRYLQNCKVSKFLIYRKLPFPTMYKTDLNEICEIDTLYSEYFLLNI